MTLGALFHLGRPLLPPPERLLKRSHPPFPGATTRHLVVEGV